MKFALRFVLFLALSAAFAEPETTGVQFQNRCAVAMTPEKFAPLFLDQGRIIQYLIKNKGNPIKTVQKREPNPYMPGKEMIRTTFFYPDVSFETGFASEIPKEILTQVDVLEPRIFGSSWLAKGTIQADLDRHLGRPRKILSGNRLLILYDFAGCYGTQFSDVTGTFEAKMESDKLNSITIRYSN